MLIIKNIIPYAPCFEKAFFKIRLYFNKNGRSMIAPTKIINYIL